MTASSDWSVPRAERGREIHETAPVAHQDKRFPRRAPAGSRRRRDRNPDGTADDDAPPPRDGEADATPEGGQTDETASGGDDHVIDTLA
ncbi:MAG: hypothetical protein R6X20_14390 [Phycisphaerae bacterium]